MEVRIKYELASKATISNISYNPVFGVLAVIADGNDTVTFFSLSSMTEMKLMPRMNGESRPPSSGTVSWSPNGKIIAVANTKVELWAFDGQRLAPIKAINQGYIQIKNIVWSQDSQLYLCYGITPKDIPLSLNIRNIETQSLKQIYTSDMVILANFDPFGKYIVVLLLGNALELYDAHTLDKIRSINLAETKNDVPTLRDHRLGDWSPEYGFFVCPNLNDSRLPIALVFDRNRNFNIKEILIGHQATISCAKFNPNVYEFESDTTFILAVGDSSGCLSLWRIGKTKSYKEPLFIISSPSKAEESIEGIQWNNEGNLLFINVLKKYIVMAGFREGDFGKKFTEAEKTSLIVGTYGASGASQIAGARFEIFGQNELSFKNDHEVAQDNKSPIDTKFMEEKKDKPQGLMVRTEQQTIYNKGKNNKEKKTIIPSRLVPESELNLQQNSVVIPKMVEPSTNGSASILEKLKMPTLRIPPLKQQIKREYYLPNDEVLQVQHSKDVFILSRRPKMAEESRNKRLFQGQIKAIAITRQHVLVLNADKLFIFDSDLKAVELPCFIGEVCNFTVNNEGVLFYMTSNGLIKGFNYIKHEFILETSAAYLLMTEEPGEINFNPFSVFTVFDSDSNRLHVELKSNLSRYFYCKDSNSWVEFNFEEGFYIPGHSLRITKQETEGAQNFYNNLVNPIIKASQMAKGESTVSQFELQLLYYGKYAKDGQKFKDALVRMLADLKSKGNSNELRKEITKYFIDRSSPSYIGDPELWNKVKRIGGKVIEEFIMLGPI